MSACRSCSAPIVWAVTENGKRIPLDAEAVVLIPTGAFRLVDGGEDFGGSYCDVAVSVKAEALYVSHFATCPNADAHRKGKT